MVDDIDLCGWDVCFACFKRVDITPEQERAQAANTAIMFMCDECSNLVEKEKVLAL